MAGCAFPDVDGASGRRLLQRVLEFVPEDVELRMDLDDQLPPTKANPEQLHQVFLNLGQNALQSMREEGGRLTVATRTLRRGRPRTTWIAPAEEIAAREKPITFIQPRGALPFWDLLRQKATLLPD